jgi:hypothetical protein
MPQPIAYNTGSQTSGSLKLNGIEYAISSSIVSGSNGQRWFTSVNPGNGIVLVTNSFTQSYSTYQNSTPLFYTASALTAAAITGAINGLPDRFGQVPFTTTASAYAWVADSRKYFMMNYEYPQIVTDGLISNLDAKFLASYPTTQSTWYNISGNDTSGSLINGPTFNQGQGAIVLDGIDDFINQNFYTSTYYGINQSWTIDVSLNIISSQSAGNTRGGVVTNQLFQVETDPGGFGLNIISQNYCINLTSGSTGAALSQQILAQTPINYNKNEHITALFDSSSSTVRIYRNGVLANSSTSVNYKWTPRSVGLTQRIGTSTQGGWGFYFPMKFYNVSLYNKALSQQEILQNYYQGPIVTDGLVFAVDAGNIVSYESGSTTTYSLTGSLSGSLVNGVGYSQNNGGNWVFDGIDDYINSNYKPVLVSGNSYSQAVWFRTTSATVGDAGSNRLIEARDNTKTGSPLITSMVNWQTNNTLVFLVRGTNAIRRDLEISNIPVNDGQWKHFHCQILQNGTTQIYLNGVFMGENTLGVDTNINLADRFLAIGARNLEGNISSYFNGDIANVQIYNRALSAQEIQQNFNAQRSRFGL